MLLATIILVCFWVLFYSILIVAYCFCLPVGSTYTIVLKEGSGHWSENKTSTMWKWYEKSLTSSFWLRVFFLSVIMQLTVQYFILFYSIEYFNLFYFVFRTSPIMFVYIEVVSSVRNGGVPGETIYLRQAKCRNKNTISALKPFKRTPLNKLQNRK